MEANEGYAPFMDTMREKIYLSKVVIEYLANNQNASYEDLLNKIDTTVPPQGLTAKFTEDTLLRHSQWIVDQVIISNTLRLQNPKFHLFYGLYYGWNLNAAFSENI